MAYGWTSEDVEKLLKRRGVKPTPAAATLPQKPAKYRNRKTALDGYTFDSLKEATRYQELRLLERAGLIRDLALQVSLDCYGANGERVCQYVADFRYVDLEHGRQVWEDVKGGAATMTRLYRLKKKLLAAQGITITET